MDIRKLVMMMGVGMVLMGCGAGKSRLDVFGGRMAKGESKATWKRQWAAEVPKELLPYCEVLDTIGDEFRREGYGCSHEYCMYDISGDGKPELWLTSGCSESNKTLYVYMLVDNRPVKIFEDECGHLRLYMGKDKVIRERYQGPFGFLKAYVYDGDRIRISDYINYDELNDEEMEHASDEDEEKRFQALRVECVETKILEFREITVR